MMVRMKSFRAAAQASVAAATLAMLGAVAAPEAGAQSSPQSSARARAAAAAKAQTPWGLPGDPRAVRRTIRIRMSDDMRFRPDLIELHEGDTVRFVLLNTGRVVHEMVIGTRGRLDEHAAEMAQHRHHGSARHERGAAMARVRPGATGTLVWKFNRTGEFAFACLIPGHYEAGMTGVIRVFSRSGS
jgi:uncharacterized cupredoxin-like copper-binding protein